MNALSQLGYWFMPEELLLPMAILLLGVGLFLRFVGLRRVARPMIGATIGLVVLPVVLGPIIVEVLGYVPPWLIVVLLVAAVFYLVRAVLTIFLGEQGAGTLMAMLVAQAAKTLISLPGVFSGWARALRLLLTSSSPIRRAFGLVLAVALSLLAGLTGREIAGDQRQEQISQVSPAGPDSSMRGVASWAARDFRR